MGHMKRGQPGQDKLEHQHIQGNTIAKLGAGAFSHCQHRQSRAGKHQVVVGARVWV